MTQYSSLRPSTDRGSESSDPDEDEPFVRHPQTTTTHHWRSIAVLVLLLIANLTAMSITLSTLTAQTYPPRTVVPSNTLQTRKLAIRPSNYFPNGTLNRSPPTDYTGPPRPALERAWATLQKHDNVRVSAAELGEFASDERIVKLADGSGSMVTMSAYHGLHCVRRLHRNLYAATYYPNLTETDAALLRLHSDHCVDYLRQYIQCNADTALVPMRWSDVSSKPATKDNGNHQCVVWEEIEAWMAERSFDPYQKGLLVHPKYGDPFPDGPGEDGHLNLGLAPALLHPDHDGHFN
ncbi:hypothetical protein QBC47DRAFT_425872 [Echria macrotheca]|uniref:Uncharacterized protein n=1 Tax=Echria macrotheca TaxID=438768 RepID=A0AAJ0B7Q1_9PEZI|nr:hypothetical protein QBC47DRAFT_425872 [Echria macrotheca]